MKQLPKIRMVNRHTHFKGGLDNSTPTLSMKPGYCRSSLNVYQDINDGYKTFTGYERYSGKVLPSDAQYAMLAVAITGSVSVGDVLTDNATTSFGTVIAIESEYVALTKITGTFSTGNIKVATVIVGTCTDSQIIDGASTGNLHAQYNNLAADVYRADIGAVPGSGDLRGIHYYKGKWYAFRDNAGATATVMFASSASGWVEVALGLELSFTSGGPNEVVEGMTIEGEISGATATLTRVVKESGSWPGVLMLPFNLGTLEITTGQNIVGATSSATAEVLAVVLASGTWAGGDASGYVTFYNENGTFVAENLQVDGFTVAAATGGTTTISGQNASGKFIFSSQTGTFQAETVKVGADLNVATIAGDSSAITFAAPGGKFDIINANFTGLVSTSRMYGADGKNRGWEFDGTVFVPISTGMTTDVPRHVYFHKYHLFFSYQGSVQHSAPGLPYQWSVIVGGDEIGMGDTVVGFITAPGGGDGSSVSGTLAILTTNTIGMLYGNNIDDWVLVHYKREVGAIEWSQQLIGNVFMFDSRGIIKLSTAQAYGNFEDATESKFVQPWLRTKKTQVNGSCIVRDLNQYWLFFADKTAMCCTIDNGNIVASMPMLFSHEAVVIHSTEDVDGNEVIMFGDNDGYVYQMYKGTSFDGEDIEWNFTLAWETYGQPMIFKRFRSAMLEVEGEGYTEFNFGYDIEYSLSTTEQAPFKGQILDLSGSSWDLSTWDVGAWDNLNIVPKFFPMYGSGTNVSLKLQGSSDYYTPLRFSGALVQFNFTRERR